jgi:hypothetical protein
LTATILITARSVQRDSGIGGDLRDIIRLKSMTRYEPEMNRYVIDDSERHRVLLEIK